LVNADLSIGVGSAVTHSKLFYRFLLFHRNDKNFSKACVTVSKTVFEKKKRYNKQKQQVF
jgi:hypothetical protein